MSALQELASEFWAWRRRNAPTTRDDITRVVRPEGWVPDWSPEAVGRRRDEGVAFVARLEALERELDPAALALTERTDLRLVSSAMRRVLWELDVVARHRRDPRFYVEQALGPAYELMLRPAPFEQWRVDEIVRRLGFVGPSVEAAIANLSGSAWRELAGSAVDELAGIDAVLDKVAASMAAVLPGAAATRVGEALASASPDLVRYHDWLAANMASMEPFRPVGREAFESFLAEIAFLSFSPEEMLLLARQEVDAAKVWEHVAALRELREGAERPFPADAAAQCAREAELEHSVREFYESIGLLSQPDSLRHYYNLPLPEYLSLLRFLSVTDDLTDPGRLDVDGVSYVPEPDPSLPYFHRANAVDPRLGIVHEGAHYQQLALSWRHPDPVRREYYDSSANEGIAFYNEELLLQAGLFEDNWQAVRVMHNFVRLRALRVEVDVRLAIGELSIEEAGELLEHKVPMDRATAVHEAAFFASTPGQGLTYQVGKWQIQRLLATVLEHRPELTLRRLHDYLWLNGNVPPALLLQEMLALEAPQP